MPQSGINTVIDFGNTDTLNLRGVTETSLVASDFLFSPAPVNHAPVLTIPLANVAATAGQTIAASSLFSATDADGDALTYYILDNTTAAYSGHFVVNGVV